jgi:hypothetical protein
MNTMTVRMELTHNPISSYLDGLKMSAAHLYSALKLKTTTASVGYTALPDNKRPKGYFPKVSGLHGISYAENERDRLFFG